MSMQQLRRFETSYGIDIDAKFVEKYFETLVNLFFKILPLRENEEKSLPVYVESLLLEMLGLQNLIVAINHDAMYLSLLSILQYIVDHPECEVAVVRREVFRAISICYKLKSRYSNAEVVKE